MYIGIRDNCGFFSTPLPSQNLCVCVCVCACACACVCVCVRVRVCVHVSCSPALHPDRLTLGSVFIHFSSNLRLVCSAIFSPSLPT